MTERLTCVATEHRVIRGDRRPVPCGRPACSMRDGRPYCRDHDPDAGVLRAGRRRRRTRVALERENEALRARRALDTGLFEAAMDRLRAAERERDEARGDAQRVHDLVGVCDEAATDALAREAERLRRALEAITIERDTLVAERGKARARVIDEVLGLYDGSNMCAAADLTPVIEAAQALSERIERAIRGES